MGVSEGESGYEKVGKSPSISWFSQNSGEVTGKTSRGQDFAEKREDAQSELLARR